MPISAHGWPHSFRNLCIWSSNQNSPTFVVLHASSGGTLSLSSCCTCMHVLCPSRNAPNSRLEFPTQLHPKSSGCQSADAPLRKDRSGLCFAASWATGTLPCITSYQGLALLYMAQCLDHFSRHTATAKVRHTRQLRIGGIPNACMQPGRGRYSPL